MANGETLSDCEHDIEILCKRVVDAESMIAKIKPLVEQLSELQWEVFESPHNHAVRALRSFFSA